MKKSLFLKIFFTQIAVTLLVLFLVIPTIFMMIGEFFISNNKETVLEDAQRVASLVEQMSLQEDNEEMWKFFKKGIGYIGGHSIVVVVDPEGNVIAVPENLKEINSGKIDKDFIKPAVEGKSPVKVYPPGTVFNQQTLTAIVPIEIVDAVSGKTEFLGATIAAMPMPEIEGMRNRFLDIIIITQLIAWIITFLLSSYLTKRIINPLKEMQTAAKSIASGNFKEKIPVTSSDEIGQLAESFNSMTTSLEELENMRSSFISDVSHELRTPMTTIIGFVEGVLDGTIPEKDKNKYLSTVLAETKRLSRLVSDLLESSRLEQGKIKIEKRNLDMNRLVAESAFAYEQQLIAKDINVSLELEGEECIALADKDSIKRVLINLMDNAIKFTPSGGDIFISTSTEAKKVYVTIQNSGDGISENDLRHIWERFYKTDKSRSEDKKGVGLGLHIVKTIITQHGGEIFVESEVGKYTRFTFVLAEGSKSQPEIS